MQYLREFSSVCLAVFVALLFAGCSISNSIESSSDSFSNSSESASDSSSSSSPDDEDDEDDKDDEQAVSESSYQADVADYTAAYVAGVKSASASAPETAESVSEGSTAVRGLDLEAFRRGISEIAAQFGITNWEGDTQTYAGIGEGLKKAGVTADELPEYAQALSADDAAKAAAIEKGYGGGN